MNVVAKGVLIRSDLCAEDGIAGEFRVRREQRHSRGARRLCSGKLEEALGQGRIRVWSGRDHGVVVWIVEHVVDAEAHEPDERALPLHDQRHRGQERIGAVATDDEIDLVPVHQLLVDAGNK
jgi:hypothetical protein